MWRNFNAFVMFYFFSLLSKIVHFQVCWLLEDVIGSRAQVKWSDVIVSLENDIFGIAYTSTIRPGQSNSERFLVISLSRVAGKVEEGVTTKMCPDISHSQITGIRLKMVL